MGMLWTDIQETSRREGLTVGRGGMVLWPLQFNADFCSLPILPRSRGVSSAGGAGAAHAVLQPGAVGERVPLVGRPR